MEIFIVIIIIIIIIIIILLVFLGFFYCITYASPDKEVMHSSANITTYMEPTYIPARPIAIPLQTDADLAA